MEKEMNVIMIVRKTKPTEIKSVTHVYEVCGEMEELKTCLFCTVTD